MLYFENSDWRWTDVEFYLDTLQSQAILNNYPTLRSVANHEIGHALGLAHDYEDTGTIMYWNAARTAVVSTQADLERVHYLYVHAETT